MKAGIKTSELWLVIAADVALAAIAAFKEELAAGIAAAVLTAVYAGLRTYLKGQPNGQEMDPKGDQKARGAAQEPRGKKGSEHSGLKATKGG